MTDEKKPPQEVAATPIYAAVDVMRDRLELGFYAFGPNAEAQQIMRAALYGDPAQDQLWAQLWALLQYPGIRAAAIDSGGLHPQQIYRFVHKHSHPPHKPGLQIFTIKCQSTQPSACALRSMWVDVWDQGQKTTSKIELLLVGVKNDRSSLDLSDYARAVYDWLAGPLGSKSINMQAV